MVLCENIGISLSDKTDEELQSMETHWLSLKETCTKERARLYKCIRHTNIDLSTAELNCKDINNEILRRKKNNEIIKIVQTITEGHLLSEHEQTLIINVAANKDGDVDMDDVENHYIHRVCKEVIDVKKHYPDWTLIRVILTGMNFHKGLAPYYLHSYTYVDKCGLTFVIRPPINDLLNELK